MKIKVLAFAFSMLFFVGITATSFAQVVAVSNSTTVVDKGDDDKDKNKKKTTAKTDNKKGTVKTKDCETKQSCCGSVKLKDDGCKDKKSGKDKK